MKATVLLQGETSKTNLSVLLLSEINFAACEDQRYFHDYTSLSSPLASHLERFSCSPVQADREAFETRPSHKQRTVSVTSSHTEKYFVALNVLLHVRGLL
jgi:hypothetical protein